MFQQVFEAIAARLKPLLLSQFEILREELFDRIEKLLDELVSDDITLNEVMSMSPLEIEALQKSHKVTLEQIEQEQNFIQQRREKLIENTTPGSSEALTADLLEMIGVSNNATSE